MSFGLKYRGLHAIFGVCFHYAGVNFAGIAAGIKAGGANSFQCVSEQWDFHSAEGGKN